MSVEYTEELADKICNEISNGANFNRLSKRPGYPSETTLRAWKDKYPDFAAKYTRARENRADARSERIDKYRRMMLNRKITPEMARVAIDTEKWQAGKESPKRYGEKITNEHTGADGKPIETNMQVTFVKSRSRFADDTTVDSTDNTESA